MIKFGRYTLQQFGATSGFEQVAQFGSLKAGTPVFTTSPDTIQALSNYQTGWFDAAIGTPYASPAIEDMNALFYLFGYELCYALQQGIPEWDPGTVYYAGNIASNSVFVYTVTSANATVGATYTTNGQTFTVTSTIAAGTTLICTGTGAPAASGTLTKASGTGDATITFSANYVSAGIYVALQDSFQNTRVTNASFWQAIIPTTGLPYQRLALNAAGQANEYTYNTFNAQTASANLTIPASYNLMTGFLTLPTGKTYTVAGSMVVSGKLTLQGTAVVQVTGTGVVHGN